LADDFFAALFVGGLVATVIEAIPLRFLPGGKVYAWDRRAWAVVFAIALYGLVQVMLRPEARPTHPGAAPIVTVLVLFAGFGGASVAFQQHFARKQKRLAAAAAAVPPAPVPAD